LGVGQRRRDDGATVGFLHDAVYCAPTLDSLLAESTSGIAAHTTREAALTNALFELVERDAFVLHWLRRHTPPLIDHRTIPAGVGARVDEVELAGYDVRIADLTTDLQIPAALAIALNRCDGGRPALLLGAGAPADPLGALTRGLTELVAAVRTWQKRPGAAAPVLGPEDVHRVAAHGLPYAHPAWRPAAEFLWSSEERLEIASIPTLTNALEPTEVLRRIVARLAAHGIRVLGIDITTREVAEAVVFVVRAVAPGLQPIGFGRHGMRHSGARLRTWQPKDGSTWESALNITPHPFP